MSGNLPEKPGKQNSNTAVYEKVRSIVAETLAVEISEISDTTNIVADLGADSLAIVTVAIALDEEFDIEIDLTTRAETDITIGELNAFIYSSISGKAASS